MTDNRGRKGRPWQRARAYVLERDNWRCQIQAVGCTITATCVDHIVPLAQGGPPLDPTNLRAACRRCNQGRGIDIMVTSRPW